MFICELSFDQLSVGELLCIIFVHTSLTMELSSPSNATTDNEPDIFYLNIKKKDVKVPYST